jgi:hypothetical protein
MQGRIIDFIKNLIKTLKNELKGPIISEKKCNIEQSRVFSKDIERNVNIDNKKINSEVIIIDLKDTAKPKIKELTFKKGCNNILFFNNIINVENNEIKFDKINVKISKKDIEKSKTDIKKIIVGAPKKKCEIKESKTIKTEVLNGIKEIYKMPKKIKGRRADDFYKSEYEILIKKINLWALKSGMKDNKNLEPEYVFEKIPVKCIKNIKYDGATGWAEIFFDENNSGEKTMDFAIILNKNTGSREKIFI